MATTRCTSCGSPLQDADAAFITCPYCGTRQESKRGERIKLTAILRQSKISGSTFKVLVGLLALFIIVITAGVFLYFWHHSNESANMSILEVIKRPAAACGIMHGDEGLISSQKYYSCDKRFTLHLQNDGNLVLLMDGIVLWSTNTAGKDTAEAIMQRDGNFVLYDRKGKPLWATNTLDTSGAYFVIQNDGNLVIYNASGRSIWASHTCCY